MTAKKTDLKNDQFRIEPSNVSTLLLAEFLGVTSDAITKLHSAGVIKQNGKARGKYNLFDAVPAYLEHLRANKGFDVDAKLKLAQVQKIRYYVERMKNDLVKTSDAAEVFRAAATAWKNIADQIPKRVAARIAKSKDPAEIRKLLGAEFDGMYEKFIKGLPYRPRLDGDNRNGTENKISPKGFTPAATH